jgi:hypothetical protein
LPSVYVATMTLKNQIEDLAQTFATGVLAAIRSASLSEILNESNGSALKGRGPGRPPKSNGAVKAIDGENHVSAITGLLSAHPTGLRAEEIRAKLRWEKAAGTKAITKALEAKAIKKTGQKRATTYFVR